MKMRLPKLIPVLLALFTLTASAVTRYVDLSSPGPTPPYTNWLTAAGNIQDAVDVSLNGDTVLVTNGVYANGGRRWRDSGTNRVTLTNAVTLQSVNGPAVTLIVGHRVAGTGPALTNAVRCVGMGNGAVLSGFTLTNGEAGWGNSPAGGGVARVVGSAAVTVTNCVLIGNLSTNGVGGGAYRVSLINCQITGNYSRSGGGAGSCTLVNCTVVSNTAAAGGGVYGSSTFGASFLTNCTIVGNSASSSGGGVNNGGVGGMKNCIVYYNTAPSGSNYTGIKMNYCCTTPTFNDDLTSFTNAPMFENLAVRDLHLREMDPKIKTSG